MFDKELLQPVIDLQTKASNPQVSAWMSASAGAGKTAVLVRRVLRLLLTDGIYAENILAITYTKAAASEMSNRINDSLTKWAVCDDKELNDILTKVLGHTPNDEDKKKSRRLFASVLDAKGGLKIQTIHSFCQSLLGRFPLEAGLPQGFTILENNTLLIKTAHQMLVSDPKMLDVLKIISGAGNAHNFEKDLESIIQKRQKFKKVFTSYEEGLEQAIDALYTGLNVDKNTTIGTIKQAYIDDLNSNDITNRIESHISNLQSGKGKTIDKRLELLAEWEKTGDIDTFYKAFFTDKGILFKGSVKIFKADLELLEPIEKAYNTYKRRLNSFKLAQNTSAIYRVANRFIDIYEKLQKQHNVLDFTDIVLATEKLLSNENIAPWILHKTDYGHTHILLDESQDTAPEQWNIMRNLLEPFFDGSTDEHRTIFSVGDEKQSIYTFQGADPQGFTEAKKYFKGRSSNAEKSFEEVPVNVSFRSTPAILNVVDASLSEEFEGVTHTAMRKGHGGEVHLLPLLLNSKKNLEGVSAKAVLADELATRIEHLIGSDMPAMDKQISAGDIMVLVRNRTPFVSFLIRSLKNKGIAVAGADRMKLMEQIEVEDLISVLQFMVMPADDLNLSCLLKSPLIGMDDSDLFNFSHERGRRTLWQSLRQYNQKEGRYSEVVNYLNAQLRKADFTRPFETLNEILNSLCPLGADKGLTPMTGWKAFRNRLGTQADEAIFELLNIAVAFEYELAPTLQNFITYLHTTNSEIKRDSEAGSNEVRILTVHGSKGLQAPVVIIPNCFTTTKNPKGFMWDEDNKYCLWFASKIEETDASDLSPSSIVCDLEKKNYEELMRLLYVGMTRAEEILICGGVGTRGDKNEDPKITWYDKILNGMESLQAQKMEYIPASQKYNHIWTSGEQRKKDISTYTYVYKTEHMGAKKEYKGEQQKSFVEKHIPEWVMQNAVAESPLARPLAPSRIVNSEMPASPSPLSSDTDGIDVFKRGIILHKLLEILPQITEDNRKNSILGYLSSPSLELDTGTQEKWCTEILSVMNTYPYIFDITTRAEVPISGIVTINGEKHPVSGIIDRLCITNDTIYIVDFKSNVHVPNSVAEVPETYKVQLSVYKDLLQEIYPDKQIKTQLLWTYSCEIMNI